jgi:hypothetical protein
MEGKGTHRPRLARSWQATPEHSPDKRRLRSPANLFHASRVARCAVEQLRCFAADADAGCMHVPTVVGALEPRDVPEFKWIDTLLGNLKITLAGALHSLNLRSLTSPRVVRW